MSIQWYLRKEGQVYGPVTAKALSNLAETGQLQPTDEVLRDDLDKWVPASKVKGLNFPVQQRPAPPPLPSAGMRERSTAAVERPILERPGDDQAAVSAAVSPAAGAKGMEARVVQRLRGGDRRGIELLSDGTWRYADDAEWEDDDEEVLEGGAFEESTELPVSVKGGAEVVAKPAAVVLDPNQEYFKVDYNKAKMKEHLFEEPWAAPIILPIVLTRKLLRIPASGSTEDPPIRKLGLCNCSREEIPEFHKKKLQPILLEMIKLGFQETQTYLIEDPLHKTTSVWVMFSHGEGNSFARVQCRQWRGNAKQDRGCFPSFITEFRDGTFLVSTSGSPDLVPPPGCSVNRLKKKKPEKVWESHQKLLKEKYGDRLIRPAHSAREISEASERLHGLHTEFHLQRGLFQPLNDKDVKKFQEATEKIVKARDSGMENPEVIAELQKLQEKKPSWIFVILLFLVSAALFVGAGVAQWSWKPILMMVPILFIHELGHYLTMMMFGYKNLKMFFIPFFGAAVSGQHYNVPGWKKVIVSLAGPVPGIAAGVVLGIYGLYAKQELCIEAALLSLILNGFNLIPVLPLDGGWVMHAILFCRHPLLDAGFRVMAAIGMLGLSFLAGGGVMIGVAVAMLISLPISYRCAKIIDKLRRQGGVIISPDAKSVPNDVADKIISELRTGSVQNMNNKQLAQMTLQVFEGANARPPGWPASLFFLFVHGTAFLTAVIFSLVLVIGKTTDLGGFAMAAAMRPEQAYECGTTKTWMGPTYNPQETKSESTLVAPFKKPEEASAEYERLTTALPGSARMTQIGATLLIQFPVVGKADQNRTFDELEKVCPDVAVSEAAGGLNVRISCIARTAEAAKTLENDLNLLWMGGEEQRLIPPWLEPDPRTPEEKQRHEMARKTFRDLNQRNLEFQWNTDEFKEYLKKQQAAQRRGDKEEVARLDKEWQEKQQQQEEQRLEEIRKLPADQADPKVVEAYLEWKAAAKKQNEEVQARIKAGDKGPFNELMEETQKKYNAIFAQMGQLPEGGEVNGPRSKYGDVSRNGLLLTISTTIDQGATGVPEFLEWLCRQKCSEMCFEVGQGFDLDDMDF